MSDFVESLRERYAGVHDPILIGGYMRSGTSFVMKLLLGHADTRGFETDADLLTAVMRAWMPDRKRVDPYTGMRVLVKNDEARLAELVRLNWLMACEFAGLNVSPDHRIVEKTPGSHAAFPRVRAVFPNASFVVVVREPVTSIRSALAHSLLFYHDPTRSMDSLLQSLIEAWSKSMEQTREAARALGDRLLVVDYNEFLGDVPGNLDALFQWCGLSSSPEVVANAIENAGTPHREREYWRRILSWTEDEFNRRYETQLTSQQQAVVMAKAMPLFQDIMSLPTSTLRSVKRPGLSGSATTVTTASPGS